jgi:hypothetical protein
MRKGRSCARGLRATAGSCGTLAISRFSYLDAVQMRCCTEFHWVDITAKPLQSHAFVGGSRRLPEGQAERRRLKSFDWGIMFDVAVWLERDMVIRITTKLSKSPSNHLYRDLVNTH